MTDERPDPQPETTPAGEPPESTGTAPEPAVDLQADRRAFMRRLSGDAVWTAGRLAGFSSALRRSVVAAGEAATMELAPPAEEEPPIDAAPDAMPEAGVPLVTSVPATPAPAALPIARDPVLALTAAQHEFLVAGAWATVAVNDAAGAPHLTSSIYHWDGATIRLPGRLFTARAEHVDRDPRVSLLIQDDGSTASVALSGVATAAYAEDAEEDIAMLLAKYVASDPAMDSLEELRISGDRIVYRIRPTRFVWRAA